MSKGLQIATGALLIAALLGWYGYTQVASEALSLQYFQTLDEFHENAPAMLGRAARVHGYVALSSIERDLAGGRVRFSVQNAPPHAGGPPGETLAVDYGSLETPDLFKDGAEVVVEGELTQRAGETVFVARNVMAKCPSKFQAQAAEAPREGQLSL
ncbi:MAG: cytochrome c maturation protein CcmE [Myxococcota bacterium]